MHLNLITLRSQFILVHLIHTTHPSIPTFTINKVFYALNNKNYLSFFENVFQLNDLVKSRFRFENRTRPVQYTKILRQPGLQSFLNVVIVSDSCWKRQFSVLYGGQNPLAI